jgi:PPOX class probable F420-dependent enzyme
MTERITTAWAEVRLRLEQARSYWIVTRRPDGRPHAAPVWGVFLDGRVVFSTSPDSVKARNIAADPRVAVHLESADNVVILEGTAALVQGEDLRRADTAYVAKYVLPRSGDRCSMGDGPAWAVTPTVGHSWAEIAFAETMTRWRFPADGGEPTPEANSYG